MTILQLTISLYLIIVVASLIHIFKIPEAISGVQLRHGVFNYKRSIVVSQLTHSDIDKQV